MRPSERERVYGGEGFIRFTHHSRCVVCGYTPCEMAHVKPRGELPVGMGRKADAKWVVPLCFWHHREQHDIGYDTFQRKYERDLDLDAVAHWAKWRERDV